MFFAGAGAGGAGGAGGAVLLHMLSLFRKIWPMTFIGSRGSEHNLLAEVMSACALSDVWQSKCQGSYIL